MTNLPSTAPIQGFVGKFLNYEKALDRLLEVIVKVREEPDNDFYRDALIQRYEFTWELAWKTLKEYMEEISLDFESNPRSVLKKAFQQDYIQDEELWLQSIKGRNLLAHTYDEVTANIVASDIINIYNQAFVDLYNKLKTIYDTEYNIK